MARLALPRCLPVTGDKFAKGCLDDGDGDDGYVGGDGGDNR